MSDFIPAKREVISRVRYKGVFDFEGLYKMMREWFKDREYEFWEKRFKHKVKAGGSEVEINWDAWRDVTEFLRNWTYVYFHLWDYKEVEVVKDGQKKKMIYARMLIEFAYQMEFDYENKWQDTAFKRKLRDIYIKYALKKDVETIYGDKLWYNTNKLQQAVKLYLGMESYSDVYDDMW